MRQLASQQVTFSFFLPSYPSKKTGCTRGLVEPAQRGLVGLVGLVGEATREPGKCFLSFLPSKKTGCTCHLVEPAQRGLVGLVGLVASLTPHQLRLGAIVGRAGLVVLAATEEKEPKEVTRKYKNDHERRAHTFCERASRERERERDAHFL